MRCYCPNLSSTGEGGFIEVISGLGIAHLVIRIRRYPDSNKDRFERAALRITGFAFYTLVLGLVLTSFYNIWIQHKPVTTLWGILISILIMWFLAVAKRSVGNKLNSEPILSDANCTLICVYMSVILLVSNGIYALFNVPYMDSIGTLGLAYFLFKEGKECFEKANSEKYGACD